MSIRTERVAGVIQEELSRAFAREIDTSGFGLVSVTQVLMTPDLRLAKVYVSYYGSEKTQDEFMAFLAENEKELRMIVGKTVRLKFTPELRFYIDESFERAERIERLIREIHKDEPSSEE